MKINCRRHKNKYKIIYCLLYIRQTEKNTWARHNLYPHRYSVCSFWHPTSSAGLYNAEIDQRWTLSKLLSMWDMRFSQRWGRRRCSGFRRRVDSQIASFRINLSPKLACFFVFEAEGGDSIFVCNVGIYLAVYMALKRRTISLSTIHVKWVPCHHGMERPQDADVEKTSRYGW
jgi:hypothetical protein